MPRPFAVVGITFFLTLVICANVSEKMIWIILFFSALCFISFVTNRNFRQQAVFPFACMSVLAAAVLYMSAEKHLYSPVINLAGDDVGFSGKIIAYPQFENNRFYYLIKTEEVEDMPVKTVIRFSASEPIEAQLYDSITTRAKVYILGENNEDSLQYYKTTGVYLGAYALEETVAVQSNDEKPLEFYFKTFKRELIESINDLLPNEHGGLTAALLFGDKSYLSDKTISNFSNIGVSHIMAVSGLNLSMFSLLFLFVFERTRLNKRIGYICSFLFVLGFMALAGFTASVLRAGFMLLIIISGKILNKQADSLNSLGIAVLFISLLNPLGAAYVGLLLSFLATLGIVTVRQRLISPFEEKLKSLKHRNLSKMLHIVLDSVIITVAASLFTLPVIIIYFKKVSLVSLISNIVMVYVSTLAMVFGGFAALVSTIPGLHALAYPLSIITGYLTGFVLKSSELISKIPYSSVTVNEKYIFVWFALSLFLIALAILLGKVKNKDYLKLTAVLCSFTLIVSIFSNIALNNKTVNLTVVDVGNASAVLISYHGRAAMISCGGEQYDARSIKNAFEVNNVRALDLLLIPRSAKTESNTALDILNMYKPAEIVLPEIDYSLDFIKTIGEPRVLQEYETDLWGNLKIRYLNGDDFSCVCADISGTSILIVFYPGCNADKIPPEWRQTDIILCRSKPPIDTGRFRFSTMVISGEEPLPYQIAEGYRKNGINIYSTENRGDIVFRIRDNSSYSVRRGD